MKRPNPRALAFLEDRPGPGPETLHVDLTNVCNFNCSYCWHYSPLRSQPPDHAWATRRLPTELALAALRDAAELGTVRVLFSGGGEPLLHPDCYAIFEECDRLGLKTTLISNLSVVDLSRLLAHPPEKILANCSAATEATYLATHPNQRAPAWSAFRDRVRVLAVRSQVTLVFVVTRQNAHEVREVLELAHALGATRVQYKLADLHGPLAALAVDPETRLALQDALPALSAYAQTLGVETTLEAFERELGGARQGLDFVQQVGCYVGWFYARIGADGGVYACCKNVPIGHLQTQGFAELWQGTTYAEFRAWSRTGDFARWPQACGACGNLSLNVRAAQLIAPAAEAGRGRAVTG